MTTFKPGQIYAKFVNTRTNEVSVVMDVTSGQKGFVTWLQFTNTTGGQLTPPNITGGLENDLELREKLVNGHNLGLYRAIVIERLQAYHFDVDHFKQLWVELDKAPRFEVGKVYKKTYNTIESFYLCIGIDEDQEPMFLDDKFGWGYCQVSDSIQEGLEPASIDETIATLSKLSAGLDDHVLEIKNWREVISCSFQTLGVQVKLHPNSQVKYA